MKPTLIICLTLLTSFAMQSQNNPYPSQVHVTGKGVVKVVPDQVSITVRIEHSGTNALSVKQSNDATVKEVLDFLKRTKIKSKHIQTDFIRLSKNYEYNTKTYNYVANQAITILLDDLSMYEQVMNGLLSSGVNRIDQVSFGSSKLEQLQAEARTKAMQDAKQKATEYAAALNQTIGSAVTITENNAYSGPQPLGRKMALATTADSGSAMAPGELEVQVEVQVSFVLQ